MREPGAIYFAARRHSQYSPSNSPRSDCFSTASADAEGIECRKDEAVLDETPMAYKPIDKAMEAQADLVEVVHELRQVLCVKG